jgi:hypothetical protein
MNARINVYTITYTNVSAINRLYERLCLHVCISARLHIYMSVYLYVYTPVCRFV